MTERLGRMLVRHPWVSLAGALVVVLALVPVAGRLQVVGAVIDLLPDDSATAQQLRLYVERFGGVEQVFVVLEGGEAVDPEDLLGVTWSLQEELEGEELVATVRSGIEPADEDFLLRYIAPRALLYAEGDGVLDEVRSRIAQPELEQRARRLRSLLKTPGGSIEGTLARVDPLGLLDLVSLGSAPSDDLPIDASGSFLASSGRHTLLILTPAAAELDIEAGRALEGALRDAEQRTRQRPEVPDVEWRLSAVGGPLYAAQDERMIRADMVSTVSVSAALSLGVLVAAFGGWALPVAVALSFAFAGVLTAATLSVLVPGVSGVALGFSAVLVGLGVDYAIHGAAHLRSKALADARPEQYLIATLREAGPAILASALTTAGAFWVLSWARFRALRELGMLIGVGIVAVLIATVWVGIPAFLLASRARFGVADRPGRLWRAAGGLARSGARLGVRARGAVALSVLLITALSVWALPRLRVDPDLAALRPDHAPSNAAEQTLFEEFGVGSDTATLVIGGDDLQQVLGRTRAATEALRARLGDDVRISSPADWLLSEETVARRLETLRELPLEAAAASLATELERVGLRADAFRTGLDALASLGRGVDPGAPSRSDWPTWLSLQVAPPRDGEEPLTSISIRAPFDATAEVAAAVEEVEREIDGVGVASTVRMGEELRTLAVGDLKRSALVAVAVVLTVVAISFRFRLLDIVLAMTPVTLGTLWTLGLWALAGRPIDLIGLTVAPILLGIGIDDGLHAVHALRRPSGLLAFRRAGRAMALTTLTTAAGFGSLVMSSLPGLRQGGGMVVLGVVVCLALTLVVVPALRSWRYVHGNPSAPDMPP